MQHVYTEMDTRKRAVTDQAELSAFHHAEEDDGAPKHCL